jgi:ABC-2 type transport system ATP-binding protein
MSTDDVANQKENVEGIDSVTDNTNEPIVDVVHLSKTFKPQIKAVNDISFQAYEGEIFGFLGPNGAGKTTTISMLTTLLKPTSGTAEIAGYDITKNASSVRKTIGVVQQDNTTDKHMTGYENLMFTARIQGVPKRLAERRVEELLELVELTDASRRKVETYSGGMRRRLEVACGLINMPRVLFLDEPTLGLDVQTRAAIWNYIKRLKQEHMMTLFLTTHYMEEADNLCDRIAIIDHGQIVALGSPIDLKAKLGGDIIELGVKGEEKDLSDLIRNLPMIKNVIKDNVSYRIKAENGEEAALAVIDAVRSKGYFVTKILVNKPSLSEVYLELTGRAFREDEPNKDSQSAFGKSISLGG